MTLTLTGHGFSCENGGSRNLTSFGPEPVEGFGVKLSGGPAEVTLGASSGRLVITGSAGTRAIELPEGWSLRTQDLPVGTKVRPSGRAYQVDATSPDPVELMLKRK